MAKIINDISAYQRSSYGYLKTLYDLGSRGLMVKLTEGDYYLNSSAGAQISNGLKVFGNVGVYHYLDGYSSAQAQARYFCNWMKAFGLDKSTVWALDVEDPGLPWYCSHSIDVFISYMKSHGYPAGKIVYGSASWFNEGRINQNVIDTNNIWVAAYGASQPGVDDTAIWQYTNNFKGLDTDASLDFRDVVAVPKKKTNHVHIAHKYSEPKHLLYWHKTGKYIVTSSVNVYKDLSFKDNDNVHLDKGSTFNVTQVFTVGNATRLKTDAGYISGNSKFVRSIK